MDVPAITTIHLDALIEQVVNTSWEVHIFLGPIDMIMDSLWIIVATKKKMIEN